MILTGGNTCKGYYSSLEVYAFSVKNGIYKTVRDWTSRRSLLYKTLLSDPPPPHYWKFVLEIVIVILFRTSFAKNKIHDATGQDFWGAF